MLGPAAAPPSAAETLRIALASDPSSLDPHFHNIGPNVELHMHLFDNLIVQGSHQELKAALAQSWGVGSDVRYWTFALRGDVSFHDGTPLTSDDVVFSLARARDVPNSPGGYGTFLNSIAETKALDPHRVLIVTHDPYPLLPNDLSAVPIIGRRHGQGATTADYNSGEAVIGTGPYRFVSRAPGQRIELERNDRYWGDRPLWERVVLTPIASGPARTAALLAGDVDMIESVPAADTAVLARSPKVRVWTTVSNRMVYLHLDSNRQATPMVLGNDGNRIQNPLLDTRVRRAISIAIDRRLIAERVMEGAAVPAGQIVPDFLFGADPDLIPPTVDLAEARALLAEAGYPEGFRVTLHVPNDRYPNAVAVAHTVAQMLARVAVKVDVQAVPGAIFFTRASALDYSLMLAGAGSVTGEASGPLKVLLATFDAARGMGAGNRGRYSNRGFDQLLGQALATFDDQKRAALLRQATAIGIGDVGIIPLYFQRYSWATRQGIRYEPRTDEMTLAMQATHE